MSRIVVIFCLLLFVVGLSGCTEEETGLSQAPQTQQQINDRKEHYIGHKKDLDAYPRKPVTKNTF